MTAGRTGDHSLLAALRGVTDPASGRDVYSAGLVRDAQVQEGVARITYALPAHHNSGQLQHHLRLQTQAVLLGVPGVRKVEVEVLTFSERAAPVLPGVRHVVAVGAGKGGVGKSTVAAMLAVGLSRAGQRAGLLDGDVYGPSLPKITGTEQFQPASDADGRIVPPEFAGIPVLSMGHLIDPQQAVIWRGPMAQKYLKEFLERTAWGPLDFLLVDLPPGTGDIPLTLAQSIPLTGAVVVCTPQDVALLDAVKALRMYQKLGVEPLGLVENMSYYLCPHCGQRDEIFDHGGCARAARELGVPFLGEIPLNLGIRRNGDQGRPLDNFTTADASVIAGLTGVTARLLEEVQRRSAAAGPDPQLRIL
jgi:ATP-binding protein involved in chromosome partitioning